MDSKKNSALAAFEDPGHVQQSEDLFSLILEAAGEGVYGLDCDGRVTFANKASTEILGWRPDQCIGKCGHSLHHHSHEDRSPYDAKDCPIYAAFKNGKVYRVDSEVFWHADGRPVPVEYTSTPIWKDGRPNGAVVIFRDISDRVKMETQRKEDYLQIQELKEQLLLERDYLRDEIKVTANFGEIIGDSPALKRALVQVQAVAGTDANVLVLGESGVGKEMIARAIHNNSPRSDRPLVKVNCASIPKELFESEFFGHVQGAFTGAHKDRVGRMQLADGGTLFLDEVGEIPLSLQSKLLRVLQEGEFEKVGDEKTIKTNVRIVSATNRDLLTEVQAGRFREDLYYRLNVFPIEIPPLRDRSADILPIATHLLEAIASSMGRSVPKITRQNAELLSNHPWPGNVRELRNVMERALILTTGSRLRLDLAFGIAVLSDDQNQGPLQQEESEDLGREYLTEEEFLQKEKGNLLAVLNAADWKVSGKGGAADLLGVKSSTLTYRMKSLGIEKPK